MGAPPAPDATAPDATATGAAVHRPTAGVAGRPPATHADDRKLTTAGAALMAGVKPSTWRSWQSHGRPRPEPAPAPDGWFELRTPWWWASTVRAWLDRRSAGSDTR